MLRARYSVRMRLALQLTHDEPRLVYLALVYHLGRPGSELDPETKLPREDGAGLRAVKAGLGNHLDDPSAVIEFDDAQYPRLISAIRGSVTELRVYHMRAGAPSDVARFTETARALFPVIAEDPGAALDIAEAMVMLQRRMDRAVSRAMEAEAQAAPGAGSPPKKRRWPFARK